MLVLLLPIAAIFVGGCGYLVVSMAPPRTYVGRWLALWIAVWTEVVLAAEVLSLLDMVTPLGFLLCYVVFAGIVVPVWIRRGRPRMRLLTFPTRGQVGQAFRRHPALGILFVVLAICALVNLVLALAVPVNNNDALAYHLPRVGYWIQHGSTDHFFTHDERQNSSPPNSEFGILSMVIFARAEWPAPLGQYAAYFVCLAAAYLMARQIGASKTAALFAALVLGTMSEMILQATTPKNDLIVASFLACSVVFALEGLRRSPTGSERPRGTGKDGATQEQYFPALVLSALALGLAVGTKMTAPFFLPGLAVASIIVASTGGLKAWTRRWGAWACCCAAAVLLLGSLNYFRNLADYGSPLCSERVANNLRLAKPTPGAAISNLARCGYRLCDFGGIVPRRLAWALTRVRAAAAPPIFRALGITVNAPQLNAGNQLNTFPVDEKTGRFDERPHLHEDRAWFGPTAFFVGLPLVLAHLFWSPFRRSWARFAVVLTPVLYWLSVCALLRYDPWRGRFFVTAAVMAAPLLSQAYMPFRSRGVKLFVTWLIVAIGTSTALVATFYNKSKPVCPFPAHWRASILNVPRHMLRYRYRPRPEVFPLVNVLDNEWPERMRLGLVFPDGGWDWPLFGPRLRRMLVPLPRSPERIRQALHSGEVDMVVICKEISVERFPPLLGERPFVGPIQTDLDVARAAFWSFLLPDKQDENFLFPARDWPAAPHSRDGQILLAVGADQRFVPGRELPAGRLVFPIEPSADLLRQGPLVFELYAGQTKVGQSIVTQPGPRTVLFAWEARQDPQEQIVRVKVTSTDAALAAKLPSAELVYLLRPPNWPRFEPVPYVSSPE